MHTEYGKVFEKAANGLTQGQINQLVDKSIYDLLLKGPNPDVDYDGDMLVPFCEALVPESLIYEVYGQMHMDGYAADKLMHLFNNKYGKPYDMASAIGYEHNQLLNIWDDTVPFPGARYVQLRDTLRVMFDYQHPQGVFRRLAVNHRFESVQGIRCSGIKVTAEIFSAAKSWIDDDRRWKLVERFFAEQPVFEGLDPDLDVDFAHLSKLENLLTLLTSQAGIISQREIAAAIADDPGQISSVARRIITRLTDFALQEMTADAHGYGMLESLRTDLISEGFIAGSKRFDNEFYRRSMRIWSEFNQTADLFPVRMLRLAATPLVSSEWVTQTTNKLILDPEYKMAGLTVEEINKLFTQSQ